MMKWLSYLGAACHSEAGAEGTRDDVKEIQWEEWERADHKGPLVHMGHMDPVVWALVSHKSIISGSLQKENTLDNMAASHGSV